jgi:hypothetical protein
MWGSNPMMMRVLYCIVLASAFVPTGLAQAVPKELWGKWRVARVVPTSSIACWDEVEAKAIVGTEIEYSADSFRWKNVVTPHPAAQVVRINAQQFHDENSGAGANSSQVTFEMLGIKALQATQVKIAHPDANVTRGTIEIPGDAVLIKDARTIIVSACNVYFQARRVSFSPTKSKGPTN